MSSPEQLDRLATVTDSKAWTALVMIAVILAATVAWSIAGTLPSRVSGKGILITQGGRVFQAVAPAEGVVSEIRVEVGDRVEQDAVVAILSQRALQLEYNNAVSTLEERKRNLERIQAEVSQQGELREQAVRRQVSAIEQQIAASEERRDFLQQKIADEQDLLDQGFSTRTRLAELRDQLSSVEQMIADSQQRLAEVRFKRFEGMVNTEQRITRARREVQEARQRVEALKSRLQRGTRITAPEAGRVTEIQASAGTVIRRGQPAVSLESLGNGLELVLYVPPQHGKNVQPGMPVQISPNTAERQEYGTVKGVVTSVSDFPATPQGMTTVLRNESLVRQFMAEGAPYRAIVQLERDPTTVSGYAWTSERGANLTLSSGTICEAEITTRSQKPITMVIPLLREWTGL